MKRMEAIRLTDNQAYHTGQGAICDTDEETQAAFESIRPKAVDVKQADFVIDLHNDDDLIDSLPVSSETYTEITGQPVLTDEEYEKADQDYWQEAIAQACWSQGIPP